MTIIQLTVILAGHLPPAVPDYKPPAPQPTQAPTPATPAPAECTKRNRKATPAKAPTAAPSQTQHKASTKSKAPVRHGLGSRSGEGNHQEHGTSDDEIAELSVAQREAAALKRREAEADESGVEGIKGTDEEGDELDKDDKDEEGEEDGGKLKKHRLMLINAV